MIKEIASGSINGFRPFPVYADRTAWASIPKMVKDYYISEAEKLKGRSWPSLPASVYIEYYRNGNRSHYQEIYFNRRQDLFTLVIAECIAGNGEYLDDIINAVWLISEETTWVIPAHLNYGKSTECSFYHYPGTDDVTAYPEPRRLHDPADKAYIDLFAAETGSLISWVYYFLGDPIAGIIPEVKRRMEEEVIRRILVPFLDDDYFAWMGLSHDDPVNNWNPWINSNILAAFLVFGRVFPRCEEGVNKAIRSINRFLHFYSEDGGCDEGPSYFGVAGASLLDFIEELAQVEDVAYLYRQQKIRNMASYIYKVYIANEYYVNYADAPPRVFAPAGLLERAGKSMGDPALSEFARYLLAGKMCKSEFVPDRCFSLFRLLAGVFNVREPGNSSLKIPVFAWFPGIQVLTARDHEDSPGGFFFSAKGGYNNESHNHNDVGTFILYFDGMPVLVDAGVETYTKFTFSEKRYELWTMQSGYHNLPTINGIDQAPGVEYRAGDLAISGGDQLAPCSDRKNSLPSAISFSLDIAGAYPAAAGVMSYRREFGFSPGSHLELKDSYVLGKCSSPLVLNLLCYDKPLLSGTRAELGGLVSMEFEPDLFISEIEEIVLTDPKIRNDWQKDCLYRLRLIRKDMALTGAFYLRFSPGKNNASGQFPKNNHTIQKR